MDQSRAGCSWMVWSVVSWMAMALAGVSGCGGEGSGSEVTGLRIGQRIDLRSAPTVTGSRFRKTGTQLAAAGRGHRFAINGGVVRIQGATAPGDFRQQIQRLLVDRRRAAGPLADPATLSLATTRAALAPLTPAAFEIETLSISRAGYECIDGAAGFALGADGSAQREFSSCDERWTNGTWEGEVGFHFPRRPTGSGDLTVSARAGIAGVDGDLIVETDAAGLHFAAPEGGGARFHFGHATWVDAAGHRTAVAARWNGHTIQMTVPASVVDGGPYPAVLDPVVGPDLGTDRPVLIPADAGIMPDVATDGSGFLVAFEDFDRVRAVRADAGGNVLDFEWIDFGQDGTQQFSPKAAFGGGRYLMTWWQVDASGVFSIQGRLANPDGSLVGEASFPIASGEGVDQGVAWNGERFVATWDGFSPTAGGVQIALIEASGEVVAGSERQVSSTRSAFKPHIAAGADDLVVAWLDESTTPTTRIRAARIARDGTVLDPGGVRIDASEMATDNVALASDGHRFLLAWHRSGEPGLPGTTAGAILGDDGAVAVTEFPISRSVGDAARPAVAFDGTKYLVAWQGDGDPALVFGAAVSTDGAVLGAADVQLASVPIRFTPDQTALTWNGSRFLVAYVGLRSQSSSFGTSGIDGSLIAPDLTIATDALFFSGQENPQFSSRTVWDGASYLVSWIDERDGFATSTARAVRVSSAGQVLDPDGIAASSPSLAFNHDLASNGGRRSLLTWTTPTGAALVRSIAGDGSLGPTRTLAPAGFSLAAPLAANGAGYLQVFERTNRDGAHLDLFGAFVGANGNLGSLFPVRRLVDFAGVSVIATAGTDYLVQFSQGAGALVSVSNAGRVAALGASPAGGAALASATSGRNALVAWAGADGAVVARLFARGAFRGPTLAVSSTSDGFVPNADFDNARPMLRSVGVDGAMGAPSLAIDEPCESPAMTSDGQAQLLLTCFHFVDPLGVFRVSTRLIGTP